MTKNDKAEDAFHQLEGKRQCAECHNWFQYPAQDYHWNDVIFCSNMCFRKNEWRRLTDETANDEMHDEG